VKELLVLSASRRTDLVGCFPEALMKRLADYPPDRVHSLVIWTKNPAAMVKSGGLTRVLTDYRQIFIHLTITGMGGEEFEKNIPPWQEVVDLLGPLVKLVGDPDRICWRFDPIFEVKKEGKIYGNFHLFPILAEAVAAYGIKDCRISWVSPYKKVISRMGKNGWCLVQKTAEEEKKQTEILEKICSSCGLRLNFCSMEGFPTSRCIDGNLLNDLHPDGLIASIAKAKGQRELCGCTKSLDIGWYTDRCKHGCMYCYALP